MVSIAKKISFYLLAVVLFNSCDPSFRLMTDGQKSKNLNFECGSINISSYKSLGPGYTISSLVRVNQNVTIFLDSLKVTYNGDNVPFTVKDSSANKIGSTINLTSGKYQINIQTQENMSNKNKIIVKYNHFLSCKRRVVFIEPVSIDLGEFK